MINPDKINLFMHYAIKLAGKADNRTLPNPRVGALIIDENSEIIGEGYHMKYGESHAEINAINDAKNKGYCLKGTTMIVTLEPCDHFGKTPPCSERIIQEGIGTVIFGVQDNGRGVRKLEANGVKVFQVPLMQEHIYKLNPGFHTFMEKNRAHVSLKIASGFNARMGYGQWFTGSEARHEVIEQRKKADVLLTGVGTIQLDNPVFECVNNIVILDTKLRLLTSYADRDLNIFSKDYPERNIYVFYSNEIFISSDFREKLDNIKGVKFIKVSGDTSSVDLVSVIDILSHEFEFREILVEAGRNLTSSFLKAASSGCGFPDDYCFFISPQWFGNDSSLFFDGDMSGFPKLDLVSNKLLGNSVCIRARLSCLQV